jgi:hypothetical protein
MKPDVDTQNRIKNLAVVGTALVQISNDNIGETSYFIAKTSLQEFKSGIDKLELDQVSREGMNNLIKYLEAKIEKRLKQSELLTTDQSYKQA